MKLLPYLIFLMLMLASVSARVEPTGAATPTALVEEAYLAHRKGDFEKAIEAYTNVIQKRSLSQRELAISFLLRGEARRDAGQLDEAVLDFTRALRQWPGYAQAHFFRGRIYERQGKLTEAYADIGRALELDPLRDSYKTALGVLSKRMGESGLKPPAGGPPKPVEPPLPLDED